MPSRTTLRAARAFIGAFAVSASICLGPSQPRAAATEDEGTGWWAYGELERSTADLDELLDAHLAAEGLTRGPMAEPAVLLRRATFALTGLPPAPEERAAFLSDVDARGFEEAWSTLLDRLFQSPHYGENEARRWLDVVRYGETNGYERDSAKPGVWRYRDWVIRAFAADLPYDEFVRLQIAGDEYAPSLDDPAERSDALLATGFYRLGLWDDEPADPDQAAADEIADIVDTLSQAVFGSTLGCARCHDHKADPFSQAEYYALTAHFAGIRGYAYGRTVDVADAPMADQVSVAERDRRLAAVDRQISALTAELPAKTAASGPGDALVHDARGRGPALWRYRTGAPEEGWETPGFDADAWEEGPGGFGSEGTPGAKIGTPWTAEQIQLRTTFSLEALPEHLLLSLHHDEDVTVFLNGQLILTRTGFRRDYAEVQLPRAAQDALVVGRNVLAVHCVQSRGGQFVDVGLTPRFDPDAEGAGLCALERSDDPDAVALVAKRRSIASMPIAAPYPAQVIDEVGPDPPAQFIHGRGSVHAPGDEVLPGLPAAWLLNDPAAGGAYAPAVRAGRTSGRRRTLADWAFATADTGGGAHLTARVEANRLWQGLFGRGLCRTAGDFGRLGELPTHPALLDRVATKLIESGWSRRTVQRWIMGSAAWRMTAKATREALLEDARNDHFARFDPRRLRAEEFRDAALAASGELNRRRFGPWVFPPLAPEVLATSSTPDRAWGKSSPEDAVRRSLYVHTKRSLREPLLAVFDQPDPDIACAVRFPTNVPTQALMTLNGDFVRARAAALAKDVTAGAVTPPGRVQAAVLRTLGRPATPVETARAEALIAELQGNGLSELEALELYCLGLFNRNEFLWVD